MKHLFVAITCLILTCASCNGPAPGDVLYQINGNIPSLPDSTLVILMDQETKNMDTAYALNGHFQFEGQVAFPRLVDVIAVDLSDNMMLAHEQLFLENKLVLFQNLELLNRRE